MVSRSLLCRWQGGMKGFQGKKKKKKKEVKLELGSDRQTNQRSSRVTTCQLPTGARVAHGKGGRGHGH